MCARRSCLQCHRRTALEPRDHCEESRSFVPTGSKAREARDTKTSRIRTPATPLTTVVGCQPASLSFATAAAIASVQRPDSFSDAQHGVCRRHPGVPGDDMLDGRGTCILLLLEERLRVQGMRRRPVHQFELLLQEWHVGLRLRECPRILF